MIARAFLTGAALLAAVLPTTASVQADTSPFPAMPATATVLPDSALVMIRGKYIPPPDPRTAVIALEQPAATQEQSLNGTARAAQASPLSSLASRSAQTVTYFGVAMQSTWTAGTGAQAATDIVGMNVGINASTHSLSIQTWTAGTGGGITADPGTNSVTGGAALSNLSSGVGQSVQIAGNGNTATNEATVTYGSPLTVSPVAVINTCGTQCTTVVAGNTLGVSIVTPRGIVTQTIGSGLIGQSIQAWGDANAIANQLNIAIQGHPAVAPAPGAGFPTLLPTLYGLP